MNGLVVRPVFRPGGGGKTARRFVDLVVDGQSLFGQLRDNGYDLIGVLGWGEESCHTEALERLQRKRAPDLPSGRVALFVCPECGDLGCGAVGARIVREGDAIVWSDFAYEHPYVEGLSQEGVATLGPYHFNPTEYFAALQQAHLLDDGTPT